MHPRKARVRNGQLVLHHASTDLPEGAEVELMVVNDDPRPVQRATPVHAEEGAAVGYQLVEAPALDDLVTTHGTGAFGAVVLDWVVEAARDALGDVLAREGAELEVVRVEYLGSYLALGVRYSREPSRDLGSTVESFVEGLVRTRPALDLIAHLARRRGAER